MGNVLHSLQHLPERYDIGLFDPTGDAIGGLVLTGDDDVHVGHCLSVVAQYVLPEYRNKGVSMRCMREAVRIARKAGAPVLAYTHRQGAWRYQTIYKEL